MLDSPRILEWQPYERTAGCFHVARTEFRTTGYRHLHTHRGFAEFFWVDQGPGRHWINDEERRLDSGDLVLVREADVHDFSGTRHSRLGIVNVAFAVSHLADLRRRYFADLPWPWTGEKLPCRLRPQDDLLAQLSRWALHVTEAQKNVAELHWLLLTLLRSEAGKIEALFSRKSDLAKLPDWLVQALHVFEKPEYLRQGVAGLAELTRHSPEHISRLMHQRLGMTPSRYLYQLRMEYLGRQLRMTERSLEAIAADVGLHHTGYIHRCFKQYHGLSPKRFRQREQSLALTNTP